MPTFYFMENDPREVRDRNVLLNFFFYRKKKDGIKYFPGKKRKRKKLSGTLAGSKKRVTHSLLWLFPSKMIGL